MQTATSLQSTGGANPQRVGRRLPGALPDETTRLVLEHEDLASRLARRFVRRRGEFEDLRQVALLALVRAADRFDAARGVKFSSFASKVVVGELKRYRRDHGWDLRVGRRLQERCLEVARERSALTHRLGRSPSPAEIADALGLDVEAVLEAHAAAGSTSVLSMDHPVGADGASTLADMLGTLDPGLERSDEFVDLAGLLARLAPRDRVILYLRFYEDLTQSEIAECVGVSQMHVSRELRRILGELRAMAGERPTEASWRRPGQV